MSRITALAVFLALAASGAFAGPAVPDPGIDNAAVKAFPQEVFEHVTAKITQQTTVQRIGPDGLVRWQPRTIRLVVFVKAPSHTYADTYLYAMRYAVAVLSEADGSEAAPFHLLEGILPSARLELALGDRPVPLHGLVSKN